MTTKEEEPPLHFPEGFPTPDPDGFFVSLLAHVEPNVKVSSPFDHLPFNLFKHLRDHLLKSIGNHKIWNLRFLDVPPPSLPRRRVTKFEFNHYQRKMEAQIRFLKENNRRQGSDIKKLEKGFTDLTHEQEGVRKLLMEMADDIKSKLTKVTTAEKSEELRKLYDELSRAVNAMKPGKSKFRISNFEGLITIRQRCKTVIEEMLFYSALVTVLLQVSGYITPMKIVGPGQYEAVEKKIAGIIHDGYCSGMNFHGSTFFQNSLAVMSGFKVENGISTSSIFMRFAKGRFSGEVTSNLQDSVVGKFSLDEVWGPDMKLLLHVGMPNQSKAEIKSLYRYGAFRASLGLNLNPVAYLSASVGTNQIAFGGFCEVDTIPRIIRRYSAGITLTDDLMTAKFSWNKLNNVETSVLKTSVHVRVHDDTSVVVDYARNTATGIQQLTYGVEHSVDEYLTVKARVSNDGTIAAMVKQRLSGMATVAMSTEFNHRLHQQAPRFGLSFSYGS